MAARKVRRRVLPLLSRPQTPRVATPFLAIAVDTAKISGWAFKTVDTVPVWMGPPTPTSGVRFANDLGGVDEVVKLGLAQAERFGIPRERVMLVLEAPWGGKRHTIFGLGKAHGVWEAVWKANGLKAGRIVRVKPSVWRRVVLGRDRGLALYRSEQDRAKIALGYDHHKAPDFPQDQAAAICIAEWASVAPQVSSKVPRRIPKRKAAA